MLLYTIPLSLLILTISFYFAKNSKIKQKKILIIGGTSGLGLELARELYGIGNIITITSTSKFKLDKILKSFKYSSQSIINGFVLNSKVDPVQSGQNFDIIFYCAGISIPGYFSEQDIEKFQQQIEVNYIGMIRTLYHFKKYNNKHFDFIMFSSTLALFSIPGFASYSPSKSCLKSFGKYFISLINKNKQGRITHTHTHKT